jgi:large repetitive protein
MNMKWTALRGRLGVAVLALGAAGGLAAIATVIPASAASFTVNTTSDTHNTAGATTCPASCSLRAAIEAANNLGGTVTINVPVGTYGLSLGELQVGTFPGTPTSYAITIQGAGAAGTIINQTDVTNRVFDLDPTIHGNVNVTIDGVTVSGGHDAHDNFGGAGIISGSPPGGASGTNGSAADSTTVSNSIVTNNHVTNTTSTSHFGGGVQNIGGNLTITNSTVSSNSSGSSLGGGVYYDSHSPSSGTLTVTGSTFSSNTITSVSNAALVGGGGIYAGGTPDSHLVVTSSTFTNNVVTGNGTAPVAGGGIISVSGDLQVTHSTFTGNQANGPSGTANGGGAIMVGAAGDAAANFFVHLNRIVGNSATHGPSGVFSSAAGVDFTNNWWGCNAGPGNTGCDGATGPTTSPRLQLTATASPSTIRITQTSTVTASLKFNSNNVDTSGGGTIPNGVAVTFSNGTLGTVSPTSGTLTSATASTTYTAGSTGGLENVPVQVDNQTVNAAITVQEPPHITSANNATFLAGASVSCSGTLSNCFHVTMTGFPAPTVSEAGALPSGVTLTSGGTLSGTPATGTGGVYTITLTATNGVTPDATQSFTLTVNEAPHITSANNTTFTVGSAGTFTVTSRGWPVPTITLTSGSLPSGVAYDSTTHVLSGTPASGTGGTYALQFTSHNTTGPDDVQSFTLTIDEPASITSASSTTFSVGSAGTFSVTTGGFPRPTISKTGALPSGVTLVDNLNGTATLSGTPAAGTGGTYGLTITAHNGIGSDATQSFTLTVDEAASVTSANHTTFTTGTAGTFTVTTGGFPTPSLGETGALPGGVTFVDNGDGTATLSGTPDAGTGGTYALTITAHNGIGADGTQSFTLTVDQHPAITSADHTSFNVGSAGSFSVTTTGFPTGASMVITETGALPTGVTFVDNHDGTATLSGTPGNSSAGDYSLSLAANNGVAPEGVQSFTLHVLGAPHITSADHTTFVVGTAGSFTVTTTGSLPMTIGDGGATLPGGVSFVDNGDGTATLSGTPAAGSAGSYPFTITASNGQLPDATQSFTLQVNQGAAITSADHTTFTAGTAGSFAVQSTGTPMPTLSKTGALPSGVTFVDNGDGTATLGGTPGAGTGGTYSLTITAHNGVGSDATQSFTLTVDEQPSITSAAATTFTVGSAGTFTVTTGGFPTPSISDGTSVLPSGVSLVDNGDGTATLSGTPAAGSGGTYDIGLTASNGVGTDATQTLVLTVDEAAAIGSADNTTFTVGTLGSFEVDATGFPTPSLSETGALPGGVSFVDNGDGTATLSGTPATGSGGIYNLSLKAHNGVGSDAIQAFTLTVNEAPTFTSAASTTFTVGSAGSFSVVTEGFPAPAITETGALPSGVSLVDNGDGTATLSGTPATGSGGVYTLHLKAANGVGSDGTQTFTLTVDEAVSITSTGGTTFTVGSAGSFTVTTRGFPVPTLGAAGTLPGGVTFVDNGDGTATLSGTPAAGSGGTHTLHITAHNGQSPDALQTFVLTVDEAASITSADHTTFTTGTAGSFTVTTRGYPVPTLSETGALPGGVSFVDNGNGTATLAGTPAPGTGGTYSLALKAHNGIGSDGTQSFTLTVDQPAAITSANSTTFVAGTAGSFGVTTTGFPVPSLSRTGTLPSGVSFTDNGDGTGTLSGTPATGSGGVYHLTFTAHNGVGSDATQSFTLTVNEAAAITSANTVTFQVSTAGTFTVTTRGFPTPSLSETGALPSGVSFADNGNGTATLSGTPASGSSGSYNLTLTAHNGVGSDGTQAFTLIVGAAPTTTTVVASTTTPTLGQSVTFTATVAPVSPATGTPAGTVTFSVDGVAQTTVTLSGGHAAWTTSGLQAGAHTIRADYNGQANTYKPSFGTVNVTVSCASNYTGTIKGGLSISGGSACINNAKISGGVTISNGASVSITKSTINNGINSSGAKMLSICGDTTSVGGSISVSGTTGFLLIGSGNDDPSMPCTANSIGGGITLSNNSGGFELGGNTVKGAVMVNNNVLSVGTPLDSENAVPEIEANNIKGSLSCSGNNPAPIDDLKPNTVSGGRSGQCGAAGF